MGEEGLAERALRMLAGGVNSPIRSRMPVGFFAARGEGPYLYDTKGKRYLDYCLGYGPLILGHAHPAVADAICSQAVRGTLFGCTSDREVAYAEEVLRHLPSHLGMVRCVNSGTEATMAAIRLARGITGREDIVAFDGSYHGAHDQLLARRAPGEATSPSSRGVCPATVSTTHLATFNDIEKTADLVRRTRAAAVIAEPVMGNMGCILPEDGFLSELRAVCTEEGALLILDEVITGFRLAPGGAQEHFGVAADIATYGKVAGGGLPIGLVAGSREVMEHLSPTGPVYNAGTFNGNPLSMAAGCAALAELRTHDALARIATHTKELVSAVSDILPPDAVICSCPGMFQVYFGTSGVHNAEDARAADGSRYLSFQQALFSEGVFLPPSMHESNFLSAVHDAVDIEQTIAAMERALL